MANPGRTQKQIAERYKGNLGYYKKKHPWRVARFSVSFFALVGGLAAILAYQDRIFRRQANEEFFSSGKLSNQHAKFEQDCAQCHDRYAAIGNDLTWAKFKSVIKDRFHRGIDFSAIDHKCQECHEKNPPFGTAKKYDLHEPNTVENRSCSICHQEHLGPGSMKRVADLDCASCHNDRAIMDASAKKGATLPPDVFHLRAHPVEQIVVEMPRPAHVFANTPCAIRELCPLPKSRRRTLRRRENFRRPTDESAAGPVRQRCGIRARCVFRDRSLQAPPSNGRRHSREFCRLRFLPRSKIRGGRRTRRDETDPGRSLDAADAFQPRETCQREMRRLPSRHPEPRDRRSVDARESELRHLPQPERQSGERLPHLPQLPRAGAGSKSRRARRRAANNLQTVAARQSLGRAPRRGISSRSQLLDLGAQPVPVDRFGYVRRESCGRARSHVFIRSKSA